jgi:hypothetical protein
MKPNQDVDHAISEHQNLVKTLRSTSHDDDRREAKKQAKELQALRRKKVRDGLPRKPAPDAYPGVELGDSLYIHHPERGPIAVKVCAQGRHGITGADNEGSFHRAKWQHVLGAKQRLSQRLTLVEQGEEGAIMEDEQGERRYLAIDPEAQAEPQPKAGPLRKSQPTAGQIEAGNYKKEHRRFQGLDISIENPKGSVRAGTDPGGKSWCITMHHAYGYIRGTCGVDKDHVDCYLGPNPDASHAYVVHQRQAGNWKVYDEDKVMMGFDSAADAKAAYLAQYDDPRFFGDMTAMPMADFKRKALATRHRPQMIKGLVLFFKAEVKGHTRRLASGKVVTVKPYTDQRQKQSPIAHPAVSDPALQCSRYSMASRLPQQPMTVAEVQDVVDKFKSRTLPGNTTLAFRVYATAADAFGPAIATYGRVKGAWLPQQRLFALAASHLSDRRDVETTLRHEVLAHYGLNPIAFGIEIDHSLWYNFPICNQVVI